MIGDDAKLEQISLAHRTSGLVLCHIKVRDQRSLK